MGDFYLSSNEELAQFCMENPVSAPSFTWYPDSWFGSAKVSIMSPMHRGIYATLLFAEWQDETCSLPNSDAELAILARAIDSVFLECSQLVRKCFFEYSGRLFNRRLCIERSKIIMIKKVRADAGKLSAIQRFKTRPAIVKQELNKCSTKGEHTGDKNGNGNGNGNGEKTPDKDLTDLGQNQNCELFQYWLSKPNLAKHRTYSKDMQRAVDRITKEHPIADLKACLDAYDAIMGSVEDYFGKYNHSFDEFFRAGVQKPAPYKKFMPEMKPLENLKKRGQDGRSTNGDHKPDFRNRAPAGKYAAFDRQGSTAVQSSEAE